MTPFEKLGYKVGDKFEVVSSLVPYYVKLGDVVTLSRDDNTSCPFFKKECGKIVCLLSHQVRPLKTEAERRGAKFGVGGVVKATGDKGVFWKSSSSYLGEEWYLFMHDGNILVMTSSQIRLDHEPEYKEIPFSEATHEQRMDVSALRFGGGPVEQIVWLDNGAYAFTTPDFDRARSITEMLTVRIPS